jgi:hypothetical protein
MAAAAGNQLTTLQELRTSNPEQQWEVVKVAAKAAECANLSMLQWVMTQQPEWTVESIQTVAVGAAGAEGDTNKIMWLCQRFPDNSFTIRYHFALASMKCGAVESLRWLASVGFLLHYPHYATTAIAAGQLGALRYLVEEAGCPWAVAVRKAAVKFDSAEMLEWARTADQTVWSTVELPEMLAIAGQTDKLRVAAWLRAAGAEWPTSFLY